MLSKSLMYEWAAKVFLVQARSLATQAVWAFSANGLRKILISGHRNASTEPQEEFSRELVITGAVVESAELPGGATGGGAHRGELGNVPQRSIAKVNEELSESQRAC
jgi:hypothetical protein